MAGVPKLVLIGDTLISLYENMVRIRRFSEAMGEAIDDGLADVHARPIIGLEAVAAGVGFHLTHQDLLFSSYPALDIAVAKGIAMSALAAQWMSRSTGCGGGLGGGRRFAAPECGFLGATDDTAAPLLNAVGAAVYLQQQESPHLAAGFFHAEGLTDGAFHEALRCAGQWELPVLFVGQIDTQRELSPKRWATIAKTYGVAAVDADGRSVSEVYAAANEAVRRAREEEGPSILLLDVAVLHAGDELAEEDDPLMVMQEQLLGDDAITEDELDEIYDRCGEEAAEAIEKVKEDAAVDWRKAAEFLTPKATQ